MNYMQVIYKGKPLVFLYKQIARSLCTTSMSSSASKYSYETLNITQPAENVTHVELNRPEKANSLSLKLMMELKECFDCLSSDPDCRAVVLSGTGRIFCAGIDVPALIELGQKALEEDDLARRCRIMKVNITSIQDSMSSLEKCSKPVIAAIHGPCIGAGVDLICSTDIRYCSSDAYFQIKEVDMGLAADIGTLQRFPKLIGSESLVRELALTARKFKAEEARQIGLVSAVHPDKEQLLKSALEVAAAIAEKSPVAVQCTKEAIIHARDHSVEESLKFIANLNMSFLQSEDVQKSIMAQMNKEKALFAKY